jgi:hypothetical protein
MNVIEENDGALTQENVPTKCDGLTKKAKEQIRTLHSM